MRYTRAINNNGIHHQFTDGHGYVWATAPDGHPRTSKRTSINGRLLGRGYVKRCVLVAEKTLGRLLKPNEVVHHKNRDKSDDRPGNLEVLKPRDHCRLHAREHPVRRRVGAPRVGEPCANCATVMSPPWDGKRGLCNACYIRARRYRKATGDFPAYAKQFVRSNGHE